MKFLISFLLMGLAASSRISTETVEDTDWVESEDTSGEIDGMNRLRPGRSQYTYSGEEEESKEADGSSENVDEDSVEYSYDGDSYWALPQHGIDYSSKPISAFLTLGSYPYLLADAQYHAKPVPGGYSSPWVPIVPEHSSYNHPEHHSFHSS